MSRAPYLKVYWGDFLASTQALSRDARKAYLVLLLEAWQRDASLPNDDTVLARLAMCTTKQWKRVRAEVMAKWHLGTDNRYRQGRLTAEFRATGGAKPAPAEPPPRPVEPGRNANSGPTITDAGSQQRPSDAKKSNEINDPTPPETSTHSHSHSHSQRVAIVPPGPPAEIQPLAAHDGPGEPGSDVAELGQLPGVPTDPARPPDESVAVGPTPPGKLTVAQGKVIRDALLSAAGGSINMTRPNNHHLAIPLGWINEGLDFWQDCVPVVRALSLDRQPNSIQTWGFYTAAIRDAHAARTNTAPTRRRPGTRKRVAWGAFADGIERGET